MVSGPDSKNPGLQEQPSVAHGEALAAMQLRQIEGPEQVLHWPKHAAQASAVIRGLVP